MLKRTTEANKLSENKITEPIQQTQQLRTFCYTIIRNSIQNLQEHNKYNLSLQVTDVGRHVNEHKMCLKMTYPMSDI